MIKLTEGNLKIALAVAVVIICLLLLKQNKECSSSKAVKLNQGGMALANKLGVLVGTGVGLHEPRRILKNEDAKFLIPILDSCEEHGGYDTASPQPGNPGCHITCGGGGKCGRGPEGMDSDTGLPMNQKCCSREPVPGLVSRGGKLVVVEEN